MSSSKENYCCVDQPPAHAEVDPLSFPVSGWVWRAVRQDEVVAVEAWADGRMLGWTSLLRMRPDVADALGVSNANLGFSFFCHHPAAHGRALEVGILVRYRDGSSSEPLTLVNLRGLARDYRRENYGVLLDQECLAIQGRPNIYNSGPSLAEGSPHVVDLLRERLGPPPKRILDVGCGLGYYGRKLREAGYEWMGAETKAEDCEQLAATGLPHRQVDGKTLPFADGAFDAAICIEVLEHIANPDEFLTEVKRVSPHQLLISVPNCEIISYLSSRWIVPWHMLEPDHKNFFTRWSLGHLLGKYYSQVEVGFHSPHPIKSDEGADLYYHLFAVATGN